MEPKIVWNGRDFDLIGYNEDGTALVEMKDTGAIIDVPLADVMIVEEGEG